MTFIPSTPRTEEERAETLRRLLGEQPGQTKIISGEFSLTTLPDRYRLIIPKDNTITTIELSNLFLDVGRKQTLENWQLHNERKTKLQRTGTNTKATDVLESDWDLPSVPDIAQLVVGMYQNRKQIEESHVLQQYCKMIRGKFENEPIITSTLSTPKNWTITHHAYAKPHIVHTGPFTSFFNTPDYHEKWLFASFLDENQETFVKAAKWLTGEEPMIIVPQESAKSSSFESYVSTIHIKEKRICIIQESPDCALRAYGIKISKYTK